MFRVHVRPTAFHLARVAAFICLLLLIAGIQPFSRAPSSPVAAQGPTATPNPLAIPPGGCTHALLDNLVQAVIQTWTDTGQIPQDMLRVLLDGLSNCYADLNVPSVTTCDQQAVQRVDMFILVSLITRQPLNGAEVQSLLQVLDSCYGFDLNADALMIAGAAGGGGNGGGNAGGSNGGGDGGGSSPGGGSSQPGGPTEEYLGPYQVVKIMNLGGETLDGLVCAINRPFSVHMDTPRISFDIGFMPVDKTEGNWNYAYDFPGLGESHDATGSYTISAPAPDSTRSLEISGSDHVVFNGFDGPFPMNYTMQLQPVSGPACVG